MWSVLFRQMKEYSRQFVCLHVGFDCVRMWIPNDRLVGLPFNLVAILFFFISGCDACEPYCKALPGMHNSMSKKMPKIFLTSRDYESLRNVFEDKLI